MTAYVALVRAVNVSGTGKLPKEDLRVMGEACGFDEVRTFINSGNLLFASDLKEAEAQELLATKMAEYFGRPVQLFVRNSAEMAEAARRNPFTDDKPGGVMAHFIGEAPVAAMLAEARDAVSERMALGPRLIYVSYREGIGKTKLKLPAVKHGTARSMNSVAKIAELLAGME